MNFRNYETLSLALEPGLVLIQGDNGQGKSNLLASLYLLAIAKSPRASADRELVRWQAAAQEDHAQVSALVERNGGHVRVQVDFRTIATAKEPDGTGLQSTPPEHNEVGATPASVQKYLRVNGIPRRSSDLVGEINAVMFSAQDLELVLGPPGVRRRYLDILISQLDRRYLRTLQRYQRVVYQRNHLLRSFRDGRPQGGELEFWDDELVASGVYIMSSRARTLAVLSGIAGPIHRELTGGGEGLKLEYRPSVQIGSEASEERIEEALRRKMEASREREVAQGITVSGPHRDDLQMLVDGMDAGLYASRGQCRTVVLAMKLAEASHLREQRGEEPVLLLDDVLSELDAARRSHVLETVSEYQQCFITTTDVGPIDEKYLCRMARFVVRGGQVEQESG